MVSQAHVKQTLERLGVAPDAPQEEVRVALARLGWHPVDIAKACWLLSGDEGSKNAYKEALHVLMRTDGRLRPETLSSLLGVDVELEDGGLAQHRYAAQPRVTTTRFAIIIMFGILFGGFMMLLMMWFAQTGIFHPTLWQAGI